MRNPSALESAEPLYSFQLLAPYRGESPSGQFCESAACAKLVRELDYQWQGYDHFSAAQRRRARAWVETTLATYPEFLEGGLALATMQSEAGEYPAALTTASRFVQVGDALLPEGYKGQIPWGDLGNRCYHRLLWLHMELLHRTRNLPAAAKVAKRMLRLNPSDNMGVRELLPFLLLQLGDVAGARRALKELKGESGLLASVSRAFVAFAEGKGEVFRRELATALFTLPILREFLLNDSATLLPGDSGYRGVIPDMEAFLEVAWPTYLVLPGLQAACCAFLEERDVRHAERVLFEYWEEFREVPRRAQTPAQMDGWPALLASSIDRVAPRS